MNPRLTIPSTFQLANRRWTVQYRADMKKDHGLTDFDAAVIYLNPALLNPNSADLLFHTWLHELLHAASSAVGWDRVNRDEVRIDALAGVLAQALATARVE